MKLPFGTVVCLGVVSCGTPAPAPATPSSGELAPVVEPPGTASAATEAPAKRDDLASMTGACGDVKQREGATNEAATEPPAKVGQWLRRMAKDAVSAFDAERMSESILEVGGEAEIRHELCGSAKPVPEDFEYLRKSYWQSAPEQWHEEDAPDTGWACLRFSLEAPQPCQLGYDQSGPKDQAGGSFCVWAKCPFRENATLTLIEGRLSPVNGELVVQVEQPVMLMVPATSD